MKYDPAALPVPYHLPDQPEVRAELAEYYQSVSCAWITASVYFEAARGNEDRRQHARDLPERQRHPLPRQDDTLRLGRAFAAPRPQAGPEGRCREPGDGELDRHYSDNPRLGGVKQPVALTGRSLLPVLEQESPSGWDVVFGSHQFHEVTMYYPVRMIRTRTHKLLVNSRPRARVPVRLRPLGLGHVAGRSQTQ